MTTCIRRPGSTWTGCRCPECAADTGRTRKRYAALHERWSPTRQAGRDRLDTWTRDGYTAEWISSATGIPFTTVWTLTRNTETPHIATARALLAADITTATTGSRPAHGTTRRLQALAAIGHTLYDIEAASGLPINTTSGYQNGKRERVTAETWHRVNAAWDKLANTPGRSQRTRNRAAANGWAPPLAWDEESIENIDSRPFGSDGSKDVVDPVVVARACAGDAPATMTRAERAEATRVLTERGMSAAQIAGMLGVTDRTVVRLRGAA